MNLSRVADIFHILGFICFVLLLLFGEEIESYSITLYWIISLIFVTGLMVHLIRGRRDRHQAIADKAIARYKKEVGQ